jgi:hypothetical protein
MAEKAVGRPHREGIDGKDGMDAAQEGFGIRGILPEENEKSIGEQVDRLRIFRIFQGSVALISDRRDRTTAGRNQAANE